MVGTTQSERRATLESVARTARVSRQTVSNALHRPQVLSPDTLLRVQRAIDVLGYRPNRNAQSLRTGESRLVGLRVDPVATPSGGVLDRFLHALAEGSRTQGYQLLVFSPSAPDDELSGYRDLLTTMTVDAFVLTATHQDDPRLAFLAERGTPVVSFGRPWGAEDDHHWVDVDGAAGTAAAVDHLVALGHSRIGYLGWPHGSDVGDDRRAGWSSALARHGLVAGPSGTAHEGLAHATAGATALLSGDDDRPTAVVCASDVLAVGVLHALTRLGLRAGQDLAVTGFDDSPAAALLDPSLTTVHQPLEQVATELVRVLGELLLGRPAPPTPPSGVLIEPRLVVRDSSGPPINRSKAPPHTEENA